jgi:hypothetical protein
VQKRRDFSEGCRVTFTKGEKKSKVQPRNKIEGPASQQNRSEAREFIEGLRVSFMKKSFRINNKQQRCWSFAGEDVIAIVPLMQTLISNNKSNNLMCALPS